MIAVNEARFLLQLAGEAALLLWGLHMVQSGIQRAYGGRLQSLLGAGLNRPWRAVLAGLGVTAILQSSTATALMVGAFTAAGLVALIPALAAMLGANLGTALLVQVLSFDLAWLSPLLILGGVVGFRRATGTRMRDLGRVFIGLGLMLLALALLGKTLAPVERSAGLREVLGVLAEMPLLLVLLAAALAWAAHSSVAGVLFIAALAGGGSLPPDAAIAMVLGANLGTALNPLLQAHGGTGGPPRLRLPVGNLMNRALGCAAGLALLPDFAGVMVALDPDPVRLVANAHLAFNLVTALVALPLLRPQAWLLAKLLPPPPPEADPATPRYLDRGALGTPSVALAHATREALRVADVVRDMVAASARGFTAEDRAAGKALARMDDIVDALHRAIHAYLAALPPDALGDEEARRVRRLQGFVIALEQAADVLARDLAQHAAKRQRRGLALPPEGQAMLDAVHAALTEQLSLAIAVFLSDNPDAARQLVAAKERLRETESEAARRVVAAGGEPASAGGAAPSFVLDCVRDLRRVSAQLAAVAHPVLEQHGILLPSRLLPAD